MKRQRADGFTVGIRQACKESLFRIHILEQRLKRHEEQALQKYYDLDSKLRADVRLDVLMTA
jgi:hypothetical protein